MPAVAKPPLKPLPGETQVEFFVRAFRALKQKIPNRNQRSVAVLKLWKTSPEHQELAELTAARLPPSEFIAAGPSPIFAEHTVTEGSAESGDERRVVYDREALESIVARCNERILDTGDFAPLTDGHTPTAEQKAAGAEQPEILGYDGPFYLGVIGNRKPRWAIFADEHCHRADLDRVKRLPRRSPEVWLEPNVGDRILDPIAALGAETPRLDCGMTRFSRASDGRMVARYSAAAFPGGFNTSVPEGTPLKSRNAAGESSMLTPEDVKQVVDALMQTAPMQWVASQMQQSGGGAGAVADDAATLDDDAAAGGAPADDAAPPDLATDEELGEFDEDETSQYAAMDDGAKCAYMKARRRWRQKGMHGSRNLPQYAAGSQPYSRDASTAKDRERALRLERENKELKARVSKIERTAVQQFRYAKLADLSREYAFDPEEEATETADLTDPQFEKHCERIVSRYQRLPTERDANPLPTPALQRPKKEPDVMRYHREAADLMNARGITYKEAAAEIKKKHNLDFDLE
jgi:hypothetical protein